MKHLIIFIIILNPLICTSQSKWHSYVGIHASMDAGGYYVGPSFQAGADYSLKKRTALSIYVHYFPAKLNTAYTDGSFEKGKYRSAIIALLFQSHLSRSESRGLFCGIGLALQKTSENYISDMEEIHSKRTIAVAAMRFGYLFPLKNKKLAVEINAVGPHRSEIGSAPYITQVTELLTQLSLGTRLIF